MPNALPPFLCSGGALLPPVAPPCLTTERIQALMARKEWSRNQVAAYLGVPLGTLGNWLQGTRRPPASVSRLLDVLGRVEALAPDLHATLIPPVIRVKSDG